MRQRRGAGENQGNDRMSVMTGAFKEFVAIKSSNFSID
jgi:hypothetical protein